MIYKNSLALIKYSLIFFCLLNFYFSGQAQLIDLPNIELITEKDGLPFNSYTAIVQDKQGFIWVASTEGLARYDGYSFITFQHKDGDSNSLPNNNILALAVDNDGAIWASHLGGYLSKLTPSTFSIWSTKIPGAEESTFRKIFCDSKGRVWCYMDFMGIYLYDGKSKFDFVATLTDLPTNGIVEGKWYNRVTDIIEVENGEFWITSANGLYRFSVESKKFKKVSDLSRFEKHQIPLNKIIEEGNSGFWIATYGRGLFYYNRATGEYTNYLFQPASSGTTNIINGLIRKSKNEIWIAANGRGLGVFNTDTKKFNFFYEGDSIDTGPLSSDMLVDRAGIVWVTSDKGIYKWDIRNSHFLFKKLKVKKSDNLAYYSVIDILEDERTGRIILGTQYTEGVFIIQPNGKVINLLFDRHSKAEEYLLVTDLMQDRDGRIWVVTRDFLYELTTDNKLKKVSEVNALLPTDRVPYFSRIIQAGNGEYWMGSRNGLFHKNRLGKWERFTAEKPNELGQNRVLRIAEDKRHRIWMAHPANGLTVYDPSTDKFQYLKHQPKDSSSLVSNMFTEMISSPTGEIWISTLEGISRFDDAQEKFVNYTTHTGLPTQIVYSITLDDESSIWAMTDKGLIRIKNGIADHFQYNFKDGLKGIYSSFMLKQGLRGKIYVCTYQGFYTFYPSDIVENPPLQSKVVITSINNNGEDVTDFNLSKKILVDYNSNSVSIEFSALNYRNPLSNEYLFKMQGLNQSWTTTNKNVVTFSGLPSGDYNFLIQLKGNTKPELISSIQIVVTTPFWKQFWFRFLTISLIVGISFLVYRARLKSVRQEEKLKADFNKKLAEVEMKALKAQMSPHFIFNSLNSINRYIIKSEPEKASLYLTKFSKLIRLILDNSNNKIISLEQELIALKLYIELESLRFNDKFTYTLTVSNELSPMSIGVPPMIIQPFIENAIWHGLLHKDTPGELKVNIGRFGHGLQVIIEDNGVGRKRAAELKSKSVNKEKSYGMKITSDRLTMLNGESKISSVEIVDMEDSDGKALGTKVIVKILSAELEPEF